MADKKFLDYEGFKLYHDEQVKKIKDLAYDPQRMFDSKEDLVTKSNWPADKYGRIFGLKTGLIVTVDDKIWQLVNPTLFEKKISYTIGVDLNELKAEQLGWKIVGSKTEFEIDGHTLKLYEDK